MLTKIVSSMEKCFFDDDINKFKTLNKISMLKNERLSFQLITFGEEEEPIRAMCRLEISGALSGYITARTVESVPVIIPAVNPTDDNFLRTAPGLYPDVLQAIHYGGKISVLKNQLRSVWLELDTKGAIEKGEYEIKISLARDDGSIASENTLSVNIIGASLPEQSIIFTQWFHCDCLANYYHCEPWSERHWEIVENFAKTAVRNGINLLLTPVFTPPLDTAVGGERLTVQLVDVVCDNGKYSFGFEKLDRWIDMCDRIGVKYFEISHFFTQWGAKHAPKVMARKDGEYKKIFGWETCAVSEEYTYFLREFIKAFLSHMKARGDDKRCLFHISDEPNLSQLDSYRAAKASIADLLQGYTVIDALSSIDFYRQGIVETPVPSSSHIKSFIEAKIQDLWTYYCGQAKNVSNRMIAMPLWRTRSIGMQFYKYDIAGFLHWGYNFYNNMFSVNTVNPYIDAGGEFWVSAGDTYSVYPHEDGTALESVRVVSFYEALQDMRAMQLAGELCGKENVVAEIEKIFGNITFDRCAHDAETLLSIREKVNEMISSKL